MRRSLFFALLKLASCQHGHKLFSNCPCTLIDVGLNNGESLLKWAPEAIAYSAPGGTFANLPSIVDDAAWPARRSKLQQCIDDKNTCYYGFEANPSFDETLDAIERTLRDAGRPVKLFTRTAFNINDQPAEFLVEPPHSRSGNTGSTLEKDKGSHFIDKSGQWRHNNNKTVLDAGYQKRKVASVNASAFLSDVIASSGFVAVKMDIEGFEYTLLEYLLLTNPRAICGLDIFAIEWHGHMVPKHATKTPHLLHMLTSQYCGVSVLPWT